MYKLIRISTVPITLLVLLRSQLKFMAQHYDVLAVSSKGAALDEVGEKAGVRTVGIDMTRKITPFKDLVALWRLYILLKKERPTMVHTHTPKAGILGMIAARLAGVPLRLHTVAGMPLLEKTGVTRKLLDFVEKLTYKCATNVYPNSGLMKQIIIENRYCNPDKLKVIGNGSSNGIDTSFFDPALIEPEASSQLRNSLNIQPEDILYCFIGRIVADKGIHELIDAFSQLALENANVKLLLLGLFERHLDPLSKAAEDAIKGNDSIIWVDFQKDVRPYLSISDIFVFPSYREGFPNVVMQAGAMGLPSIVSDINGCNEIIDNGINGLIIPVKDKTALHKAMEELLLNIDLRQRMADCSRRIIVEKYDHHFLQSEMLKEYAGLCNNGTLK
ncbi:MAG: glycosyltransferase family 4 protein [Pyrinomonadaceae bacterium]|nr:glycosyltransferase family 4 protein [Sphingobacteriaceae bacterium]